MATILKHPLLQRLSRVFSILLVLFLLGLLMRPIEAPAWDAVKAGQPDMNMDAMEGTLGQGLIVGVLGGFRAILADFLWIRTDTVWQQRDRAKLDAMVRLVTTLDPRPDFFWINGSRMIAYDVPNWRIEEEGGYHEVPESRQKVIDLEQAEQALRLIDHGLEIHPKRTKLLLEKAQIYLNRLKDNANAAAWFLEVSKQDDAPYYAARIYAELLRREGQHVEAYTFLKELHRDLPNIRFAQKDVVLVRIHDLEKTLDVPAGERYTPAQQDALTEESPNK